jgi:hypothetical protein
VLPISKQNTIRGIWRHGYGTWSGYEATSYPEFGLESKGKSNNTITRQDFLTHLVVEAHAVENVTNVLGTLGSVGETAVNPAVEVLGRDLSGKVGASGLPGGARATHGLDGGHTSEG